ncbi:MAG: D-alanyl-D-alanine carboxypeptidase, partial [Bradymonadaceae bacterium]
MTSLRRTCLSGALVLLSLATATAGAAAPPDAGTRPDAGPTEPEADGGESSEDGGAERVDGSEFRPFSGEADRDPPSREAIDALGDRIDAILEENVEPSANVGIAAVDATTGTVLYERNPELPQNPASNMKLVTSAAALDHFGPDHTFETRLSIVRDRRDEDRLKGPLYLSSTGAPFVLFEDVLRWAAAVRRAGVEKLERGIVVDDTAFEDAYLPPGFGQKDEDGSYRSPVGAVSVNFNAVQVTVTPPDEGMADPTIEMSPPNDYVDLEKHVRTLPGDGQSVSFSSEPIDGRRTRIRVAGAIGADSEPV